MKDLVLINHSAGKNILVDKYRIKNKDIDIANFLAREEKLNEIFDRVNQNVYMILGWDGTILKAIWETAEERVDYLPINFWTKWFLLNSREAMENHGWFKRKSYPLLDIKVFTEKTEIQAKAFNEIAIKATWAKMVDTDIIVWEYSSINMRWDGLLISTPAGSTGYNRSAGWPLLPHNANTFIATGLNVFEPRWIRPIVFPNKQIVKVHKNNARKPELSIFADDQTVIKNYRWNVDIIVQKSRLKVNFLIANSYLKEFENKVYAEQWFVVN